MTCEINIDLNRIMITGNLSLRELPPLIAIMHNKIENEGYPDLVLDFSECTKAFQDTMVGLVARCQNYWANGIDINLVEPKDHKLKVLFRNTNWSHLIDFRQFEESNFKGHRHVPVQKFSTAKQQTAAVNKILDVLLKALDGFERNELTALEWSINELTDNVITHSESGVGGFIQVTNFTGPRPRVEVAIADAGLGVPRTIRAGHQDISTDTEALDKAIREGFTRDKSVGQGNGLYGSWRVTELSGGDFEIYSCNAHLVSNKYGLQIKRENVPFNGSLVVAKIGYTDRVDLSDALTFNGEKHTPVDFIEIKYEMNSEGDIEFVMLEEAEGFGSRPAGKPVRLKLLNLLRMVEGGRLVIDFKDIPIVSSSFADEVFGKAFVEIGPLDFGAKFQFKNVDPLVKNLIDKAISQRLREGVSV